MSEKPADRLHVFESEAIVVTWSRARCIHAAECVRQLPEVFEPGRKPWVRPERAHADEVARVVARCPTGALHAERRDGGPPEAPAEKNVVYASRSGPLYLRGRIEVLHADGTRVVEDLRVALCRCGASRNKPFCDNSHWDAGFRDRGDVGTDGVRPAHGPTDGVLRVTLEPDGPMHLEGPFVMLSADGQHAAEAGAATLCRCGQSEHKPFCDGSHKKVAFEAR